jgi:phosphoribosylformylglycinamidine cyclo-ligase
MPGFYDQGEYDLAGFVVGLVDNEQLVDGSEIAVGQQIIGIGSSGLHSNGYSLVRRVFFDELKMSIDDHVEEFGRTLGEELLEPTRIYRKPIASLRRDFHVFGICHITGGGLLDNLPRILPRQCKVVINTSSWTPQPIFQYLRHKGHISIRESMRVFNNGLGLVMVINEEDTNEVLLRLESMGEKAYHIGSVEARNEEEEVVQFTN